MLLAIVSDLHMEIWKQWFPEIDYGDADVVVFLGDIGNGTDPLHMMKKVKDAKEGREVIYIIGNHEYYKHNFAVMNENIHELAEEFGIILLDKGTVKIGGVTFIGATLWTDYEINTTVPKVIAMAAAKTGINDHRVIHTDEGLFSPEQAAEMNAEEKEFIFSEIAKAGRDDCVVLTHHAPSKLCVAPEFIGSPLNGAFCNEWDDQITEDGPLLWAFGHTHWDVDFELGHTRVVSRQLGYPGERVSTKQPPFEPLLIVI